MLHSVAIDRRDERAYSAPVREEATPPGSLNIAGCIKGHPVAAQAATPRSLFVFQVCVLGLQQSNLV